MIKLAPCDQPQKSEQPRNNERRAQPPSKVKGEDEKRRHCAANRRAAVEQRGGQPALMLWKPLRDCFGCTGPIAGFSGAEKKTKTHKRVEAPGERREHGNNRIPEDGQREAALGPDAIHEPAVEGLAYGIGYAERYDQIGVVRVRPVVVAFQKGCEQRECLAIDVVNHRRGEQQPANPPSEPGDLALTFQAWWICCGLCGIIHVEASSGREGLPDISHAPAAREESVLALNRAADSLSR